MSDPSRQALDNLRIQNPTRKPLPYDRESFNLAAYFLQDTPGDNATDRMELAGQIQQVIEDFIEQLEQAAAEEAYRETSP